MIAMRRKILIATALGLLVAAGTASALEIRVGDIILNADGGFTPTALPKHEDAPITIHGGGKLSTVSGELPPIVENLNIEFDRHGSVQTTGLEVCQSAKLQATDVPAARRACPNAIVGKGFGHAIVQFPESRPIPVSSPITIFNGPREGGDPTVLAHAYTTVPVATTQWTGSPWDSSIFVRPDGNIVCGDSRDIFVGTGSAAGARDTGFHVIIP
jgi:hypothetical protein